jgi:outer membrane protein with beta-barrel domain
VALALLCAAVPHCAAQLLTSFTSRDRSMHNSPLVRGSFAAMLALALSSGTVQKAAAQQPTHRFELVPFSAAFVPTGAHANTLESGFGAGLLGAYAFNQHFSAVGRFAYSSTEDRSTTNEDVNVFTYDIGAEAGIDKQLTAAIKIRPFLGVGMGGRAYDYDDRESESQYDVAGYGAGGAQLMMGRFGWRVEVRNYLSGFKGLSGELDSRQARNDLSISSGMVVRF